MKLYGLDITIERDEDICTSCFKVVKKMDRKNWVYLKFNHLMNQNICPECFKKYKEHLVKLQEGL